jgi:hypothetical protein
MVMIKTTTTTKSATVIIIIIIIIIIIHFIYHLTNNEIKIQIQQIIKANQLESSEGQIPSREKHLCFKMLAGLTHLKEWTVAYITTCSTDMESLEFIKRLGE